MDDPMPLASLSLTHVTYNPDDPVSLVCAYLALVPQALLIVYVTLLFATREAEVALMFAGQLACEAVNFVLKRVIKEERPTHILQFSEQKTKGYGMPSSHAQFVAFWAVGMGLFLLARHQPRANKGRRTEKKGSGWMGDVEACAHGEWSVLERVMVTLAAMGLAGAVSWSRIYLGYHTEKQVLVGSAAGVVSAAGWFVITSIVRQMGLLSWALELPVARWFRIRDLIVEEDLCQAGWDKWEAKRATSSVSNNAAKTPGDTKTKTKAAAEKPTPEMTKESIATNDKPGEHTKS